MLVIIMWYVLTSPPALKIPQRAQILVSTKLGNQERLPVFLTKTKKKNSHAKPCCSIGTHHFMFMEHSTYSTVERYVDRIGVECNQ